MRGINIKDGCITVKLYYRDPVGLKSPCPSCLYEFTSFEEYKNIMYLLYCMLVSMDDYLVEVDDIHVKQRKSKKKSRQKDIQKSCR